MNFIGIRDGLFNEEIFNDLYIALKNEDSIDLCVKARSNLEIILKNVLASNKIVEMIGNGNNYARPKDIAKSIWNKPLWRLLNEACTVGIIDNEQFKSLNEIKKKCDNVIHNAYGIILTDEGQRRMHEEIKPLFKHLLDINNELRKE